MLFLGMAVTVMIWFLAARFLDRAVIAYIIAWYDEPADDPIPSFDIFFKDRRLWYRLLCRDLLSTRWQALRSSAGQTNRETIDQRLRELAWLTLFSEAFLSDTLVTPKLTFSELYADWIWLIVGFDRLQNPRPSRRILFLAPKRPRTSYCAAKFYVDQPLHRDISRLIELPAHDYGASDSEDSLFIDASDPASDSTMATEVGPPPVPIKPLSLRSYTKAKPNLMSPQRGRGTRSSSESKSIEALYHDIEHALQPHGCSSPIKARGLLSPLREGFPDFARFPRINDDLVNRIQLCSQTDMSPGSSMIKRVARKIRRSRTEPLTSNIQVDSLLSELQPRTLQRPVTCKTNSVAQSGPELEQG